MERSDPSADGFRLKSGAVALLVDDDSDVLASLEAMLNTNIPGLRVLTASNGEMGLTILREETCDVVLSDYRLGTGMDGVQLLREAAFVQPRVGRMAMAASPDQYLLERGRQEGFMVLSKPIGEQLLLRLVRNYVQSP